MNTQQKELVVFLSAISAVLSLGSLNGGGSAFADEPPKNADQPAVAPKDVGFFEAITAKEIDVTFIPKNATAANVLIENKTSQPLRIRLPEAFAGVPILAQIGGGFGGGGLGGGGLGGGGFGGGGLGGGLGGGGLGGGQGVGGGFGGGGLGGGGLGGGGFGGGGDFGGGFNVAPDSVRKLRVRTVCLEHGKREPRPRMKYVIQPIDVLTQDPQVIELCKMVGGGKLDRGSAQAAAWYLANGMSWVQLARKVGRQHLNGSTEPYFTTQQIALARRIAAEAERRAKQISFDESTAPQGKADRGELFRVGLQQAEEFRQNLLSPEEGDGEASRAEFIGEALVQFLRQVPRSVKHYSNLEEFRLRANEIVRQMRRGTPIEGVWHFGKPAGQWYAQSPGVLSRYYWYPVELYQPALQLDSTLPRVLAAQYVVTNEGVGWNYLISPSGDLAYQLVLGIFYQYDSSGVPSAESSRPHVGYLDGQGTLVWIHPDELRLEPPAQSDETGQHRSIMVGRRYALQDDGSVQLHDVYHTVYARSSSSSPTSTIRTNPRLE